MPPVPEVGRNAEVTLVTLVYRSLPWLQYVMDGVAAAKTQTRYKWCIVSNDGTPEVRNDPRITIDWENADPSEHYIARTYRAWTEGILNATTPWVILLNNDMQCTDYAIDELIAAKRADPKSLPCGLLVENGRIPSGMPEFVRDFGTHPDNFRAQEFLQYANTIRHRGVVEPGRLYQPVLFDRQEYFDLGGYPCGNVGGVSGDRLLFDRYVQAGFRWITCKGSVWYHHQEGEIRNG